jgi:hypothetical protein
MGCQGTFTTSQEKPSAAAKITIELGRTSTKQTSSSDAPAKTGSRTATTVASPQYAMEQNTNRSGEDYKDLDLRTPNPALCAQACATEARCKAWTYVKPGIQAENAKCWLKENVPAPTPDENCVSGVMGAGVSGRGTPMSSSQTFNMEMDIDLPGDDYRDLDLSSPDPNLCARACMAEEQCKAWTYVKPGIQAENARCWLKDKVPSRTSDENCISGIKRKRN